MNDGFIKKNSNKILHSELCLNIRMEPKIKAYCDRKNILLPKKAIL